MEPASRLDQFSETQDATADEGAAAVECPGDPVAKYKAAALERLGEAQRRVDEEAAAVAEDDRDMRAAVAPHSHTEEPCAACETHGCNAIHLTPESRDRIWRALMNEAKRLVDGLKCNIPTALYDAADAEIKRLISLADEFTGDES